jgi:hypothetical protein
MILTASWARKIIFTLVVVVTATGAYFFNQTSNQTIDLMRVAEVRLDSFDVVEAVSVFDDEIYVAGWDYNQTNQQSYAILMKLSNSGDIIWEKTWAEKSGTYAREITCDENGIYVVVEVKDELFQFYKYLTKLDFNGDHQWRINATNIGEVVAYGGGVYTVIDDSLIKLDSLGQVIWSKPVNGLSVFIHDNRIYVGGSVTENASGGSDSIVTAFDTDGTKLWSSRRESTKGDQIKSICATDEGVYVVGSGTKGWSFFYMAKYSLAGEQLWDKQLIRTINGSLVSLYPGNGEIYAAGALGDSPDKFDALTLIIDKNGNIVAKAIYDEAGDEDYAYSICSDGDRIYVAGTSWAPFPLLRHGILLIYEKVT